MIINALATTQDVSLVAGSSGGALSGTTVLIAAIAVITVFVVLALLARGGQPETVVVVQKPFVGAFVSFVVVAIGIGFLFFMVFGSGSGLS